MAEYKSTLAVSLEILLNDNEDLGRYIYELQLTPTTVEQDLLVDPDSISNSAIDTNVIGIRNTHMGGRGYLGTVPRGIVKVGRGDEFILDRKPKSTNINYYDSHRNVALGQSNGAFSNGLGNPGTPKTFDYNPSSIVPFEAKDLGANVNRLLNLNITTPAFRHIRLFRTTSGRTSQDRGPALLCYPMLKSGIAFTYDTFSGQVFNAINPVDISAVVEMFPINGTFLDSNTEEVVSTAYHPASDTLFIATINDFGDGKIIGLDATSLGREQYCRILIPAEIDDSDISTSNVDILFNIYIKTNNPDEDFLYVNFEGSSGQKKLRIYDLSPTIAQVFPPASPTPTPTVTPTPTLTPTISATPPVTPTTTLTATPTPTLTVTPSVTATVPVTPTVTPTISVTPSITPTIFATPTPTPTLTSIGVPSEYRYTRKTLNLDNLVPCQKYKLKLEALHAQYGEIAIQILDFNDLGSTQYDNEITFESRNLQKYFRDTSNGPGSIADSEYNPGSLPIAHDDKVYQAITYTIYHSTGINTFVLKYTLTSLSTGKTITESRVVNCGNREECVLERVDCEDQNITKILQKQDGTFRIYVSLDPRPRFGSVDDLTNWINDNKCCNIQYKIDENGTWTTPSPRAITLCEVSLGESAVEGSVPGVNNPIIVPGLPEDPISPINPPVNPPVSPPPASPPPASPPPASPPPASPPPDLPPPPPYSPY